MARGNGTITTPWDLETALQSSVLRNGDTLFMRGGTYTGDFVSYVNGTSSSPIRIKPYSGERVIIDGSLTINGSYAYFENIEFTYSGWTKRETDLGGSEPADIPYSKTVTINGPGIKLINCLIYDMAGGPGWWAAAIDSEINGCVIWNVGWSSTDDRGHGHSIYTQNNTGTKTIKNTIAFNSFSTGLKIYTLTGNAQGYRILNNAFFDAAVLYDGNDYGMNYWIQTPNGGTGYYFENNHSYHSLATGDAVILGLYDRAFGVSLINNYFPEGITKNCEVLVETGNYYGPGAGDQVFVDPNEYLTTRANVTIYNAAAADSVEVDLTSVSGLAAGNSVTVRNVQDYFTDVQSLTLDGDKKIVVDMRAISHTVATPAQWTAPATTFPTFGCFVVEVVT